MKSCEQLPVVGLDESLLEGRGAEKYEDLVQA
jgi:hypothetical protein